MSATFTPEMAGRRVLAQQFTDTSDSGVSSGISSFYPASEGHSAAAAAAVQDDRSEFMRGTRGKSYSSEEELIPHFASDKGMLMLQATHMMFRQLQTEGGDDSKSSTLHFTRSVDSVRNRRKDETQPHGSGQGTAH